MSGELADFLKRHGYSNEQWESSGLTWEFLCAVGEAQRKDERDLKHCAENVLKQVAEIDGVHTVRSRVKSADSLMEKVLRKKLEKPSRVITLENLWSGINDRAGVRALHLYKSDWIEIHRCVQDRFYLLERPVIFYREGDSVSKERCKDLKVKAEPHKKGYRSVHYVLKEQFNKKKSFTVELQVRTQAEDLWAELDHRSRYGKEHPPADEVQGVLQILNVLSGLMDETAATLLAVQRMASKIDQHEADLKAAIRTTETLKVEGENSDALDVLSMQLDKAMRSAEGLRSFGDPVVSSRLFRYLKLRPGSALTKPFDDLPEVEARIVRPRRCSRCMELMGLLDAGDLCTSCRSADSSES